MGLIAILEVQIQQKLKSVRTDARRLDAPLNHTVIGQWPAHYSGSLDRGGSTNLGQKRNEESAMTGQFRVQALTCSRSLRN